jgi:hypothetical protein
MSFHYMLSSEDEVIAEGGLSKIIAASIDRGSISKQLAERLHELRLMRIAYFHSHVGLNKRGAMTRMLSKRLHGAKLHRRDALDALRIVHQFLNETSPGFFKATERSP